MKKILYIFIVGIFVLSCLGVIAVNNKPTFDMENEQRTEMITIPLSLPIMGENSNDYFEVYVEEASSKITNAGHPMLPKIVKTIDLEFDVEF
jgi:hypothetical protein